MEAFEKIGLVVAVVAVALAAIGYLVWAAFDYLKSFWGKSGGKTEPKPPLPEDSDFSAADSSGDQFRVQLTGLWQRLNQHDEKLKFLELEIKDIRGQQPPAESFPPPPEIKDEVTPEVAETPPALPSKTDLEGFRDTYNAVIDRKIDHRAFRGHYQPLRIGVANAMARRGDSSIDPIFRTANDGEYFAMELVVQGHRRFVVVPRFDLTFQESSYGPGAMGKVFDCPGYDSRRKYRYVKVRKPAFFERTSGEEWELTHKGELELGQSE